MYEKKPPRLDSPDIKALQPVVIDKNTTIYIALDSDPEEAKKRYLERHLHIKP